MRIKNIMSVDLEDRFCDLPFATWSNYTSRVVETTKVILDIFEKHNVKATFFTLGYVAEKHPKLIEDIVSRGHEIASHGYSHTDIRKMKKDEFEDDLLRSIKILEEISGQKVVGFRAPWCSVDYSNLWAFDILKKHLKYDSSVCPVKFHYGLPNAPTHIYKIADEDPFEENEDNDFIEIPIATSRFPGYGNIPTGGGIYLRFLPIYFIKRGIKKLNQSGYSAMCYIHSQDLDPKRPRLKGLAWHNFIGLNKAKTKFENLLNSFKFSTACDVLNINNNQ